MRAWRACSECVFLNVDDVSPPCGLAVNGGSKTGSNDAKSMANILSDLLVFLDFPMYCFGVLGGLKLFPNSPNVYSHVAIIVHIN